jgi:DNA-binding beta-propeller fold protein YncE
MSKDSSHFRRRHLAVAGPAVGMLFCLGVEIAQANYLVSLRGPRDDGPNKIVLLDNSGNYLQDFVAPGIGGLHGPTGMAYGPDGNLYVANATYGANNIVEFNGLTGAPIGTFVSGLNGPTGLRYDAFDGNFYAANFGSFSGNTVSKISTSGTVLGNFGTGHQSPTSVAVDGGGNIYVSEFGAGQVKKFDATGNLLATGSVGATGGLSFNPNNNQLLAASVVADKIFTWDGTNANPPTESLAIDEAYVGSLIGSSDPVNMYVGGQVYLDSTHSVAYSTALGILLKYTDGNPTPTQFANFYALDPSNGVSVGDVIFTTAVPTFSRGNINEDHAIDVADISALMLALSDLSVYESMHQLTDSEKLKAVADVNQDDSVNNLDIEALIITVANNEASGAGSVAVVPEPASISLITIGAFAVLCFRRTARLP